MITLADEIISGRRLNKNDDLSLLVNADLEELCQGADKIRKELCGNNMDLCSIINGRGGANATLTGDMLTTVSNNTTQDREMLSAMGFQLKPKQE